MAIVGFNFTRIHAVRAANAGKIQVNNNVGINDVKLSRIGVDDQKATVRVGFRFESRYEPNVAQILLDGDVLLLLDKKEADALVKGWEEKKVPTGSVMKAMNHVLDRCNIQALILSRDLNLPSPVPLPKVNLESVGKIKSAGSVKAEKRAEAKVDAKPKKK